MLPHAQKQPEGLPHVLPMAHAYPQQQAADPSSALLGAQGSSYEALGAKRGHVNGIISYGSASTTEDGAETKANAATKLKQKQGQRVTQHNPATVTGINGYHQVVDVEMNMEEKPHARSYAGKSRPRMKGATAYVPKRRYQVWKGNHVLLFQGKIIIGPQPLFLATSYALILLAAASIYFFILPSVLIFVPAGALILLLTLTAVTEPGIVAPQPASKYLESISEATKKEIRICRTCNIIKPARSRHCKFCNVCIRDSDHHCPWTGTCIARRNYKYFFLFILLTWISASTSLGLCVSTLLQPFSSGITHLVVTCLLLCFSLAVFIFVGGLLVFHCYILSRGMSTGEALKEDRSSYQSNERTDCYSHITKTFFTSTPSEVLPLEDFIDFRDVEIGDRALEEIKASVEHFRASMTEAAIAVHDVNYSTSEKE